MLLAILVGIFGFLFLLYKKNKRPEQFPPGPISWPIVGNLLQLGIEPYKTVYKMREKYGDVVAIDLGTRRAVFINEYNALKEIFNKPGSTIGRMTMPQFADPETGIYRGMTFTNGKQSAEIRKFTFWYIQSGLRNGIPFETLVTEDVTELIEGLKKSCGQSIDTKTLFNIPTINALWGIIAGKKYSQHDSAFMEMINHVIIILHSTLAQGFLAFYPKFSKMFPKISGYKTFLKHIEPIHQFMKAIIEDHKKTYEEGTQRDFVDAYLQKIKSTTDPDSIFYGKIGERNLQFVLADLFLAGTDTAASALSWIVFLLAHHPQIQEKLIRTIKLYAKQGESISLIDRPSLPFVEAVINEALRYSSMLPMGAFRETLEDVDLHNYRLPKGTVVVANNYGIMHDPELWGDGLTFRPERFLNEEETEVIRNLPLIPFGIGARGCPGESLARDELFLIVTSLFKNFRAEFDPSLPPPPLDYNVGCFNVPVDHRVVFHILSE